MTGLFIGLGIWFGLWALGNGIRRGLACLALVEAKSEKILTLVESEA